MNLQEKQNGLFHQDHSRGQNLVFFQLYNNFIIYFNLIVKFILFFLNVLNFYSCNINQGRAGRGCRELMKPGRKTSGAPKQEKILKLCG